MKEFGIPEHLIDMTKITMNRVLCRVRVDGELSEAFTAQKGLRQGDSLSCILFNIALEKIIRDANLVTTGTIFNKSTQVMEYADDVVILGRSLLAAKESFIALEKCGQNMGLKVNEVKTKYLNTSKSYQRSTMRQNITIDEYNIEAVEEFVYLGSLIRCDNNEASEIKRRINLVNRCYHGLRRHFTSRRVSRRIKVRLYKTLVKPVLMFGSETWTLKSAEQALLGSFERKVLRTIYGRICEGGIWRRRYNHELYEISELNDIVKSIKVNRLRWIGHVERRDNADPLKLVLYHTPPGKRDAGRPRKRFIDAVKEDLKTLGIRNWKQLAQDRVRWGEILEEAKANKRL